MQYMDIQIEKLFLIYKRGFAKINHSRIILSDNMIIEEFFGNLELIMLKI